MANTVIMEISKKQIESAVMQLSKEEKWTIAREIVTEQFRETVDVFRKMLKKKGIGYKQIDKTVENLRTEMYAKSS